MAASPTGKSRRHRSSELEGDAIEAASGPPGLPDPRLGLICTRHERLELVATLAATLAAPLAGHGWERQAGLKTRNPVEVEVCSSHVMLMI